MNTSDIVVRDDSTTIEEEGRGAVRRGVDLCYTRPGAVRNPELLDAYRELLSDHERARHARFFFDRDRHLFLVAWALARTMLSSHADVDPAAWSFRFNRYGRPEIATPETAPRLRFNLSHTHGLVACVVVPELDVGVDVEDRRRETAGAEVARRFFAAAEVADLEDLPRERREDAFFEYWTLKEAYIKAVGVGVSLGLERFSFALDDNGTPVGDPERRPPTISFAPDLDDDPAAWQFAQYEPTPHHAMAVAVRRGDEPDLPIRVREVVPLLDEE